jgi:putative DNA primase/helicase
MTVAASTRVTSGALDAALAYVRAGLSVVPVAGDGSKRPDGRVLPRELDERAGREKATWAPYQQRLATEAELGRWFGNGDPRGVAVLGGAVSGNPECLDFDRDAETIFPQWCALVEAEALGLVARLSVARTPKPGYHVRYRVADFTVPGNTKLAALSQADQAEEKRKAKEEKRKAETCLIETRGSGGYALAPGCPAECHETGRLYEHHSGPKLNQVQSITAAERELLIRCARSFDRSVPDAAAPSETTPPAGGGPSPGDDFNARGPDWPDILEPHGWVLARKVGAARYWRRPGKDVGWSATTGVCAGKDGREFLAVFSSNARPFEGPAGGKPCSCYTKFRAYAFLNHAGDFSAAAKDLAGQGYGEQRPTTGPARRRSAA